jgi:DNA replication protein DnaC
MAASYLSTVATSPNTRGQRFQESIPVRYCGATVTHARIKAWVAEQISRGRRDDLLEATGLLLTGNPGTGKTWEMFGIGRALAAEGYLVVWAFVPDFLHDLRPGGPRSQAGGMDDLYRADLILLDDLCAHKPSEWSEAELDRLVDHRWREESPCVFTTNLPADEIRATLGERIASRLAGMCTPIHIDGRDRRRS